MERIIENLNEMSFTLPEGWVVSTDKYRLANGQGFFNNENYITPDGKVVSLFEVQRDPEDFYEYYQSLVEGYEAEKEGLELAMQFSISVNDFINMQKGDIIKLDTKMEDELNVFVGNIWKFTALPGASSDTYAVKISSIVREE